MDESTALLPLTAKIHGVNMPKFFLAGVPAWTKQRFTTRLALRLGVLHAFAAPSNSGATCGAMAGGGRAILHDEDASVWRTIRRHTQDYWKRDWNADPCSYPPASGTENTAFLRAACVVVSPCVLRIESLALRARHGASYEEIEATFIATQRLKSLLYLHVVGVHPPSATVMKAALKHGWTLPGPRGLRTLKLALPSRSKLVPKRELAVPRIKIDAGRSLQSLTYTLDIGNGAKVPSVFRPAFLLFLELTCCFSPTSSLNISSHNSSPTSSLLSSLLSSLSSSLTT